MQLWCDTSTNPSLRSIQNTGPKLYIPKQFASCYLLRSDCLKESLFHSLALLSFMWAFTKQAVLYITSVKYPPQIGLLDTYIMVFPTVPFCALFFQATHRLLCAPCCQLHLNFITGYFIHKMIDGLQQRDIQDIIFRGKE